MENMLEVLDIVGEDLKRFMTSWMLPESKGNRLSPVSRVILNAINSNRMSINVNSTPSKGYVRLYVKANTPLGIKLRSSESANGYLKIDSFLSLSTNENSSDLIGVVETSQSIPIGSLLISINMADLSFLSIDELNDVISLSNDIDRLFVFKLPQVGKKSSEVHLLDGKMFLKSKLKNSIKENEMDRRRKNAFDRISGPKNIVKVSCGTGHTILLTSNGKLYSFGKGESGQLGLGDDLPREEPQLLKSICHYAFVNIACGRDHTVVVSEDGHAYSFGSGKGGRLGLGEQANKVLWPSRVFIKNPNVVFIIAACGSEHSLLLSKSGNVYFCGVKHTDNFGKSLCNNIVQSPRMCNFNSAVTITDIAAGELHSVALSSAGTVYSWGVGESGCLGHGDTLSKSDPMLINKLKGITIERINCGLWHSVFLSKERKLYGCGDGNHGQLGIVFKRNDFTFYRKDSYTSNDIRVLEPIMLSISVINKHKIHKIACSPFSTIAVTEKNEVLESGKHVNSEDFQQISEATTKPCNRLVAGGEQHTIVIEDCNPDLLGNMWTNWTRFKYFMTIDDRHATSTCIQV